MVCVVNIRGGEIEFLQGVKSVGSVYSVRKQGDDCGKTHEAAKCVASRSLAPATSGAFTFSCGINDTGERRMRLPKMACALGSAPLDDRRPELGRPTATGFRARAAPCPGLPALSKKSGRASHQLQPDSGWPCPARGRHRRGAYLIGGGRGPLLS